MTPNSSIYFKDSPQDHNIGSNFILTGWKKNYYKVDWLIQKDFSKHIPGQVNKYWVSFYVPIGYKLHG